MFAEQPGTTGQLLSLHRQLLEACKVEWVKLDTWGNSYSQTVHHQVRELYVVYAFTFEQKQVMVVMVVSSISPSHLNLSSQVNQQVLMYLIKITLNVTIV